MLGAAIRIQTVTRAAGDPQPGADQPWIDFEAALRARYPTVFGKMTMEKVLTHAMLMTWAGTDPSLPPIILMAHQDVVPVNPGTDADWTHGPFGGVVADGYVWGRGAMDDKGSLIAILEAGDALAKSGWAPKRTVIFAFGHDEEVSGRGAQEIFALLKSRNVTPAMVLDEGYAVLDNYPLTGKPAALIGVAEKGYVSLQITATTEGGHSSRPPRESGAIRIARALVALGQCTPGTTYSMSVTVARAGNGLFGFGIEALTAAGQNAGTFVITNAAKTQIKSATVNNVSRKNVVHQKIAGIGTGSYTFDFDWTAPMTNVGTVTFYFAGNAANGNGGTTNDYISSGLQTATPSSTSIGEVSSNSNIELLYSGINDTLNISGLKEASTVTIMDINGNIQPTRKVKIDEAIELPQLTNGTYIVTVTGEQQSTRQKFMIMN